MADNPITRKEKYLAKLTGSYTGNVPDPITRVEKYLYDLCQKGISGLTPEEIENAVNKYLEGKDYITKTDADKAYQPAGSYLSGTDEGLAVSGKAADAKAVGNAVAKIEGINYTDRGTLADTDAFLINDGTGMKKSVLSKLSDFVLNKIADKVFAKLQTNNKTILGAINELNSNKNVLYENVIPEKVVDLAEYMILSCKDGEIKFYSIISSIGIQYGAPDDRGGFGVCYRSTAGVMYGIVIVFSYTHAIYIKAKTGYNTWDKEWTRIS